MSILTPIRRLATTASVVAVLLATSILTSTPAHAATAYTTAAVTLRAGTNTSTTALATVPSGVAVDVQCQAKGQAINGTYSSDWWARVTWGGRTGYLSRAYVRVPTGTSVPTCGTSTPGVNAYTTATVTLRAGTNTSTASLGTIPSDTGLAVQCQAKGQAISGTYSSDWWAKVTWGGQTGYVSRAYVRVPAGVSIATCGDSATPPPPSQSVVNGAITREEVLNRATYWLNRRVPYSMSNYTNDPQGRSYRTDCSGFVSMAFHLDVSLSTVTLPERFHPIAKTELRRGDIVGNLGPGTGGSAGHVVIFNGWVDSSQTAFYTIEQTPGYTQALTRTWGASFFTKTAYRYNKIAN